nr:extensin family protein [Methylocapsa palsarum]
MAQPVTLEALTPRTGQRIEIPDHPTLDCVAALTFSRYVRDLLVPLVKGSFDATIVKIGTGPGFDCRTRDHGDGAKLSAHAKGLAGESRRTQSWDFIS